MFISYSHASDSLLAPAVQRSLARIAKPWNKPRALNVFRDKSDLSAAFDLTAEILSALERSRYFLLLSSPESAASVWVRREIAYWQQNKTPDTLLLAITDGEIVWDETACDFAWNETNALPPQLSRYFPREPLWEDLRFARSVDQLSLRHSEFRSAVASLASKPRGQDKSLLDSEDVRQHRVVIRLRNAAIAGLVGLLVISLLAGAAFLLQRNEARQQRDLASTRQLIAESRSVADEQPALSRLLAVAASEIAPESQHASASAAVRDAMMNPQLQVIQAHTRGVSEIAFTTGGDEFITGGIDGSVKVWDTATHHLLRETPDAHRGGSVLAVSAGADRFATGGTDSTVRIWDASDLSRPVFTLTGHQRDIETVAVSASGIVASGDLSGGIRLWDIATGDSRGVLRESGDDNPPVTSAVFSDNGLLAIGLADGTFTVWDPISGRQVGEPVNVGAEWIHSLAFGPGDLLATGDSDGRIRFWHARTGESSGSDLTGHSGAAGRLPMALAFGKNGLLASSGDDSTVRLWDVITGDKRGEPLTGHRFQVPGLAFAPDGLLYSGGSDGTVRVWDATTTGPTGLPLIGHEGDVMAADFTPGGQIVTAGEDGDLRLWNAKSGRSTAEPIDTGQGSVSALAISNNVLVTGSFGGTAQLWDANTITRRDAQWDTDQEGVFAVAFGPGDILATGGHDGTVKLWDIAARTQHGPTLKGHTNNVVSIAFGPEGRMATGDRNGNIKMWDSASGMELWSKRGHFYAVWGLAFGADGTLVTGSVDRTAAVWNTDTSEEIGKRMVGAEGFIYAVESGPGDTFITADSAGALRIWDRETRLQLGPAIVGHGSAIYAMAVHGAQLVTASFDGTARLWDMGYLAHDSIERVCEQAGTVLTAEQRAEHLPDHDDTKVCGQ